MEQFPLPPTSLSMRPSRPRLTILAVLVLSFVVGALAGIPAPLPNVQAAACGVAVNCGTDATVTSALQVTHTTNDASPIPVEPDDSETWDIKAVWAVPFGGGFQCPCTEINATVSATVNWTGSSWSVSCTGCNNTTGPIRSVSVCAVDGCTSGFTSHGWAYKLIVDVDDANVRFCTLLLGNEPAFLDRVEYTTTSVDDGDKINTGTCAENGAVSPTSQTWTATDTGSFECAFNCNATPVYTGISYN